MKFLTVADIKAHTRIDQDAEDALLELYGEAAEESVLNILNRSFDDLYCRYGGIPAPVRQAALLLCAHSYREREVSSPVQLHAVPYTVDVLLKPYMIL